MGKKKQEKEKRKRAKQGESKDNVSTGSRKTGHAGGGKTHEKKHPHAKAADTEDKESKNRDNGFAFPGPSSDPRLHTASLALRTAVRLCLAHLTQAVHDVLNNNAEAIFELGIPAYQVSKGEANAFSQRKHHRQLTPRRCYIPSGLTTTSTAWPAPRRAPP